MGVERETQMLAFVAEQVKVIQQGTNELDSLKEQVLEAANKVDQIKTEYNRHSEIIDKDHASRRDLNYEQTVKL